MILNNQCFTYISTIIFDLVKKYTNIDFYVFIYDDEKINNNQYNTFNILYTQNKLTKYISITHICNKNKIFMDDKEFNNIYEILSFFDINPTNYLSKILSNIIFTVIQTQITKNIGNKLSIYTKKYKYFLTSLFENIDKETIHNYFISINSIEQLKKYKLGCLNKFLKINDICKLVLLYDNNEKIIPDNTFIFRIEDNKTITIDGNKYHLYNFDFNDYKYNFNNNFKYKYNQNFNYTKNLYIENICHRLLSDFGFIPYFLTVF